MLPGQVSTPDRLTWSMSMCLNGRGPGSLPNYVDASESPTLGKLLSSSAHTAKLLNVPLNISVPSTAFDNNQGSYQVSPISFAQGIRFLIIMSDATGFGTGGTSELLTVGAGSSCDTTRPSPPYIFILSPSPLPECGSWVFSGYSGAILPVTITGVIPGGDLFFLHATESSFTWVSDIAAGITVVFTMTDAQGRSGGSSDAEMVNPSNNAGCLNTNSPSSTVNPVASSTVVSSSTSPPTQTSTSSGMSLGTIVGVAVGTVVAVAAIVALAVFCLKRRGRSRDRVAPIQILRHGNSVELDPGIDRFQHRSIYPFPYQTDSVSRLAFPVILNPPAMPEPYQGTSSTSSPIPTSEAPYTHQRHSRANSGTDSFAAFGDIDNSHTSSSGRTKAAMTGVPSHQPQPATRIVVHSDAEDLVPEVAVDDVIELPPRYSERPPRAAHIGGTPISSVTGFSSTDLSYLPARGVDEPPRSTRYPPPV
ncbi:hypothetical protein HD554DRAFT_2311399 [Boletus coccyginus]|nr:hypothetical protein HD554DRAFT_2311399 [Boletus coccyginus]